jgi:hypothetical protein
LHFLKEPEVNGRTPKDFPVFRQDEAGVRTQNTLYDGAKNTLTKATYIKIIRI